MTPSTNDKLCIFGPKGAIQIRYYYYYYYFFYFLYFFYLLLLLLLLCRFVSCEYHLLGDLLYDSMLRLIYCTVEANYLQTRSIARPLCDSRAILVI